MPIDYQDVLRSGRADHRLVSAGEVFTDDDALLSDVLAARALEIAGIEDVTRGLRAGENVTGWAAVDSDGSQGGIAVTSGPVNLATAQGLTYAPSVDADTGALNARIPAGADASHYRFLFTTTGGQTATRGLAYDHQSESDSDWHYYLGLDPLSGPIASITLQTADHDSRTTFVDDLTRSNVYAQAKSILTGDVAADDDTETIAVQGGDDLEVGVPQSLAAGTGTLQVGGDIPAGNAPGIAMPLDTEVQIPITALGAGNLATALNANNFTLRGGAYRIAVHLDEIWNTQDTGNSLRNRSVVAMDIIGALPEGALHDLEPKYFRGANSADKAEWDVELTIYLPEDTEIGLALVGFPGIGEDTAPNPRNCVYHCVVGNVHIYPLGGVKGDDGPPGPASGAEVPPPAPSGLLAVWGNAGAHRGHADELGLVEIASRDTRTAHAPYDYQYSSDRFSMRENDIALTGWHDVSASYDAANPGVAWDSDAGVFASNGVDFANVADRRIRVAFALGLVGYLESGDTISLAVATTGNLKAIPVHAGNDHAAVSAFFFSFDSSAHDHNAHVVFDLVFSAAPAATDTVAVAITNNIIASRATAAPIIAFGVPQIDHIPTQAYRGHAIGARLMGGYWEHYRGEWPRELRSPGAGVSSAIADRQTAALVEHVDESPYLVATADVRAVAISVRALGTGFAVSGDPVYVNIWTDLPGQMDPQRIARTPINARAFETNGVQGVAYGVRTGQRFFVTQGAGSTLGYDLEVTWDANLVADRPAVTVLRAGMAWYGTAAQHAAVAEKDPARVYLVSGDGLYVGSSKIAAV